MPYSFETKLKIVKLHKEEKLSIKKLSQSTGIDYKTIWRWIKRYERDGEEGLKRKYNIKNRILSNNEEIIADLKERDPCLTLQEAKEILRKKGIDISTKGIWNIWKKYGFVGFQKDKYSYYYHRYVYISPEVNYQLNKAKRLLKEKKIKSAAKILNSLPVCPEIEILKDIPDKYLNLKRRIDKLCNLFGKISFKEFKRKIRYLRKLAEKEGKIYTALRASVFELITLGMLNEPEERLKLIEKIKNYISKNGKILINDKCILFYIYHSAGIAHANLNQPEEALKYAEKCEKLIRNLPPFFTVRLAGLYTFLENYRKAFLYLKRLEKKLTEEEKIFTGFYHLYIVVASIAGERELCKKIFNRLKRKKLHEDSAVLTSMALTYVGKGDLIKAEYFARKGLQNAEVFGIKGYIYSTNMLLSAIYYSLGEKEKAKRILKFLLPLMKKYTLKIKISIIEYILNPEIIQDSKLNKKFYTIFSLNQFLRECSKNITKRKVKKIFEFAKKANITGMLMRQILFFPEIINYALNKGIKPPLPKNFLNLPCFNRKIPVFNIKFLGPLKIYRNRKLIKKALTPLESSFLIFLSTSLKDKIPIEEIINNYWKNCRNPKKAFYNLLSSLRKKLSIPLHLLYLKENHLYNGIKFHSDWNEFEGHMVNARALMRIGEKKFAKKAFLKAFSLIRGNPFEKMYDRWSENLRDKILLTLREGIMEYKRNFKDEKNQIFQRIYEIFPSLTL